MAPLNKFQIALLWMATAMAAIITGIIIYLVVTEPNSGDTHARILFGFFMIIAGGMLNPYGIKPSK